MTPISLQIKEIENIFPERDSKPLTFECENIILKQMIRQYCKEKGYYNENKSEQVVLDAENKEKVHIPNKLQEDKKQ